MSSLSRAVWMESALRESALPDCLAARKPERGEPSTRERGRIFFPNEWMLFRIDSGLWLSILRVVGERGLWTGD